MDIKTKKTIEIWEISQTLCDICGKEIVEKDEDAEEAGVTQRITVSRAFNCFWTGELSDIQHLDVCPTCFEEKILTLKKQD